MNNIDVTKEEEEKYLIQLRSDMIDYLYNQLKGEVPLIPLHGMNRITKTCTCSLKESCRSPGKHPWLRTNWKNIGLKHMKKHIEQRKIYDLQSNGNLLNFGALCGLKSVTNNKYLVVVDIDHEDPWSLDIVKQLISNNEISFGYRTGSGGMHLWYYTDTQIRNSVKTIHPNIDIRGIGGYVVIPGSVHVISNGNIYDFDKDLQKERFNKPILDLPKSILEAILNKNSVHDSSIESEGLISLTDALKKDKKKKVSKKKISNQQSISMLRLSIADLRKQIETNPSFRIANGTRNESLYRLLSQDRRMGNGKTIQNLFVRAKLYRDKCEEKENITDKELYSIVYSAHKGNKPKIDKSLTHKDLANNYFSWVKTNRTLQYSEDAKIKMIKADNEFFELLTEKSADGKASFLPLQHIHNARDEYLIKSHGITTFFRYPLRYLAEKLKEYGFKMKRTSKGNIWLVSVPVPVNNKIPDQVYIKSNIQYPVSISASNHIKEEMILSTMTTNNQNNQTSPTTEEEVEKNKQQNSVNSSATAGMPAYADKNHRPVFFTGVKMPDLVADPNAVPWFTPPGFKDEAILKEGSYTRHENEAKYCQYGMGRRSYIELTEKFNEFIDTLSPQEQADFGNYNFIRDEKLTAETFDKIEVGQIIGVMSQIDPNATFALEVLKRFDEKDLIACRLWNGEILERKYQPYKGYITDDPESNTDLMYIAFQDVSYALAMEHFEILYYKREQPLEPKEKYLFAPYGYDDLKKEYNMVVRYRVAQGYPEYVPDDKLDEERELAYSKYLEDNQEKLAAQAEKEAEEREEKARIRQEKLEKIKEELANFNKS